MSVQKLSTQTSGHRANVERQKAMRWNGYAIKRALRRRAIERGEVPSIFQPESKRLAPDVRAMIDAAVSAGRVTKIQRGVSGIDCGY